MANRLRSNTGCLRCRQRRVKCTERKPTCHGCERNRLTCTWPNHREEAHDVWPAQIASKNAYVKLLLQEKFGAVQFAHATVAACPVKSISAGYPPLRNEGEHRALMFLASFLRTLNVGIKNHAHFPAVGHEFTVALQEPWVRAPLLANACGVMVASGRGSITNALEYYDEAIQHVRQRIAAPQRRQEKEELLVAALFLGMVEVTLAVNQKSSSLYFVLVGELLKQLEVINMIDLSQQLKSLSMPRLLQRIAYESYLLHQATGAFYHAETYQSIPLCVPDGCHPGGLPSSAELNALAPLDTNIFYMLYELARLAHLSSESPERLSGLQVIKDSLHNMRTTYAETTATEAEDAVLSQFRLVTCVAISALQIYCAKAMDAGLTSASPEIHQPLGRALGLIRRWQSSDRWMMLLSWILSVMLCAARTPQDISTICEKIEEVSSFSRSPRLSGLKKMMELLHATQGVLYAPRGQQQPQQPSISGMTPEQVADPLAFIFNPPW